MSGWFDEQIQQRKLNDKIQFEGAFAKMASTVMDGRINARYLDRTAITKNALESVLKAFNVKPGRYPDSIEDPEELMEYMLRPHGIMHRRVRLTSGWYKDAFGPMIAKRKDGII